MTNAASSGVKDLWEMEVNGLMENRVAGFRKYSTDDQSAFSKGALTNQTQLRTLRPEFTRQDRCGTD